MQIYIKTNSIEWGMRLVKYIDMKKVDQYSNIDVSKIYCCHQTCTRIAKYDYKTFCKFIEIFDDVLKNEAITDIQDNAKLIESLYYSIHSKFVDCELNNNDKLKRHHMLIQKCGFVKIDLGGKYDNIQHNDYDFQCLDFNKNQQYMKKYYSAINGLFKLSNSYDIRIDNINDKLLAVIKMLLLVAKTRIIPKCIITQKIIYFYLV